MVPHSWHMWAASAAVLCGAKQCSDLSSSVLNDAPILARPLGVLNYIYCGFKAVCIVRGFPLSIQKVLRAAAFARGALRHLVIYHLDWAIFTRVLMTHSMICWFSL